MAFFKAENVESKRKEDNDISQKKREGKAEENVRPYRKKNLPYSSFQIPA